MPVRFDPPHHLPHQIQDPQWNFREPDAHCIEIGLVNNMPSAALEATERQFRSLLDAATEGIMVRLSLIALPEIPRSDEGKLRIMRFYTGIGGLWDKRLDGLIVTGAEPQAASLVNEPYWGSLAKLLEWAECNTHSAIWSCLAAHAALLHIDGIERRPLCEKLSGVFECERVSGDPLTTRFPARSWMPHSRWNDIAESDLNAGGYRVLIRSKDAGAGAFIKRRKSLFVFFQGHPEYEADSLLLEYRRDIRRFLRRERDSYPAMPRGCFDDEAIAGLNALRERALSDRREAVLEDFSASKLAAHVRNTWRPAAVHLYRNWLLYLCSEKARRLGSRRGQTEIERASAATVGSLFENAAPHKSETGGDHTLEK